ncbi:MAG TPA: hypothetical protein QGI30_08280, partial [Anaerolineales bacterium]|nr:hypothetical protein [Anaerolineales bacterium]
MIATQMTNTRAWLEAHQRLVLAAAVITAIAYPFVVKPYILSLGIEVLIFAIFAMSLDLLLGYTGLPSFGHA